MEGAPVSRLTLPAKNRSLIALGNLARRENVELLKKTKPYLPDKALPSFPQWKA
jgi:hypothetical protein